MTRRVSYRQFVGGIFEGISTQIQVVLSIDAILGYKHVGHSVSFRLGGSEKAT